MEALVLPGLALTIVVFIGYIAVAWLRNPDERTLNKLEDDVNSGGD